MLDMTSKTMLILISLRHLAFMISIFTINTLTQLKVIYLYFNIQLTLPSGCFGVPLRP